MNRIDKPGSGEAEIVYGDGEFHVVKPGTHVICAVTGAQIPLDELRYWNVDRQEAYASPDASLKQTMQLLKNAE